MSWYAKFYTMPTVSLWDEYAVLYVQTLLACAMKV